MKKWLDWIKSNRIILLTIFFSVFGMGLLAHGFGMLNKFCFHDEASCLTYIGITVPSGRWMLYILEASSKFVFGTSLFSTPLFNGIIALFFLTLVVLDIVLEFDIKDKLVIVGISGCMVTFPAITSLFGYMYVAPFYMFGTWLGIHAVRLVSCNHDLCKKANILRFLAGVLMASCSVGIYQASIPTMMAFIVLIVLFNEIKQNRKTTSWGVFLKSISRYIVFMISFFVIYILINKTALSLSGEELLDYQSINDFGKTSALGYLKRIIIAYREFFSPSGTWFGNMYPGSLFFIYPILVIITIILFILKLFMNGTMDLGRWLRAGILVLVFPLACNFIYIMCDEESVHSLMMYGEVFFLVFAIMIVGYHVNDKNSGKAEANKHNSTKKYKRITEIIVYGLVVFFIITYTRFSNVCTLKANLLQNNFISYCNVLTSRIQSAEGYHQGMKVLYIGELDKCEDDYKVPEQFWNTYIFPYNYNSIINNYAWKKAMHIWCGFNPEVIDNTDQWTTDERIMKMPAYPGDGSIKVIDNTVVVKFSNVVNPESYDENTDGQ